MALPEFYAGLKSRLETDTGIVAWVTATFNPKIALAVKGGPAGQIDESECPVAVIERIANTTEAQVTQGSKRRVTAAFRVRVYWQTSDEATLFAQELVAHDLLIKAIMRDVKLGNAVNNANIADTEPNEAEDPVANVDVVVTGTYDLTV